MNTSQTAIDNLVNEFCDPAKNPLMKELEDYIAECERTIAQNQAFQQEFSQAMSSPTLEKILKDLNTDQG